MEKVKFDLIDEGTNRTFFDFFAANMERLIKLPFGIENNETITLSRDGGGRDPR